MPNIRSYYEDEEFITAIYDAVYREDALRYILRILAEKFNCTASALAFADTSRPRADFALGYGTLDANAMERYRRDFAHLDPAPRLLGALPLGTVETTNRLLSEEEISNNTYYKNFYQPLGFAETMGGPVAKGDGRFGVIGLLRNNLRKQFDEDDVAHLVSLMPHLIKAIELRRKFFALESRVQDLESAIDSVPVGLMLFEGANLTHANAAARTILGRDDGLRLDRFGGLRASHADTERALRTWFSSNGLIGSAVLTVPRDSTDQIYGLRATRVRSQTSAFRQGCIAISITDPAYKPPNRAFIIADLFGMSSATAHLVSALLDGDDLSTYASRSGITIHTARYHLKNAFSATGTRRQSDLIRIIGTLVRDLC